MKKFQNKYRIPSARAPWWDYANPGVYYITICTAKRECLFGEIMEETMYLSPFGCIVVEEWEKSFEIREGLHCDVWVIMPNHIHAILMIENTDHDVDARPCDSTPPDDRDAQLCVSTGVAYRSPKSISSFVAGFKSAATKRINELRGRDARPCVSTTRPCISAKPVWQTRFHDHIIRDERAYQNIYKYILTNIEQWEKDKFFPS